MRSATASRLTAGTVPRDGFVALCNDFLMLKGAVLAHSFLCSGLRSGRLALDELRPVGAGDGTGR